MKLTKRGKQARAVLLFAGVCAFVWFMITGFWWTENGLCIGTMTECLAGGL